jgi:hypothetical protein
MRPVPYTVAEAEVLYHLRRPRATLGDRTQVNATLPNAPVIFHRIDANPSIKQA